jgi:hypothetical protein
VKRSGIASLLSLVLACVAWSAEVPGAALVLDADPGSPGSDPGAAPPRFVLMNDGQVFVGGTERLESGRLDKAESSALLKSADAVRRLRLSSPVSFGGDTSRTARLRLLEGGKPLEIVVKGDPMQASPALAPLAQLLTHLLRFNHPNLRPYAPTTYAMTVRDDRLVGGCRAWSFSFPITEAVSAARTVTSEEAKGWPTGARPASVCVDGHRYAVILRPLLPGEHP